MKKQPKPYVSRKTCDDANLNPAYMSVKDNPTPEGHEFVCLTYHPRMEGVFRKYVRFVTIKRLSGPYGHPEEKVSVWVYLKLNPAS